MADESPSYQELLEQSQREWREIQARSEAIRNDLLTQFKAMPDVAGAPRIGALWSEEGIVCKCQNRGFYVKRWVTVNGVRHRAELQCSGCPSVRTWDFALRQWLGQ